MAAISVHTLKMMFGETVLFEQAAFDIGEKDRDGRDIQFAILHPVAVRRVSR